MSQAPNHPRGDAPAKPNGRDSGSSSSRFWSGWRRRLIAAAFTMVTGLGIWLSPLGQEFANFSSDVLFLFRPTAQVRDAVIVYMDEKSFRELKQEPRNWDRALHAQLLDRLTKENAKLVVFDVWFADPGTPKANAELVRAMKENGKVLLAGIFDTQLSPGLNQGTVRPPNKEFAEAAAGWGLAGVHEDHASIVRKHIPNSELKKSLPWVAAELVGAAITKDNLAAFRDRWINYYGPYGTIPSVSYCDAANQAPGFFKNKIVFVGAHPKALYAFEEAEGFRTPYTRWGEGFSPGVEIMATTFLNLYRGDWLTRSPAALELFFMIAGGLAMGIGLSFFRPWIAVGVSASIIVGLAAVAGFLFVRQHFWIDWLILAGVQLPTALACSIVGRAQRAKPENAQPARVSGAGSAKVEIPDHTVVRKIGSGSYGEVLLALDALGSYHAVKLVRRDKFPSAQPFEREFQGLKKFTPFSREHESFVQILHVGINQDAGYFYYIMELADDETASQTINPATYSPKALSSILRQTPKLQIQQCVQLGLALTSALDYLHKQGLVHRDIKPANIIYVKGKPKLADIGLVTEIVPKDSRPTCVGTLGYIAPEGIGTPAADIYSLGKVLYEAYSGMRPEKYPCPRSTLLEGEAIPALLQVNEVILKACEADPDRRYQSAAEMHAELREIQKTFSSK